MSVLKIAIYSLSENISCNSFLTIHDYNNLKEIILASHSIHICVKLVLVTPSPYFDIIYPFFNYQVPSWIIIKQNCVTYSWLSLSRTRLTRISGWVKFVSKSRTSLCINIYNLTPVESNSDESKFRLSWIKVLVPRCRKPYYLHSLSQIYLSKHVYYLRIKIGSQVKHTVIEFDIFTLGYFTCLFHNLSN